MSLKLSSTEPAALAATTLETGQVIWQCGGQSSSIVPCPVAADGLVLCMSGYPQQRLLAISLDSSGDVTDSDSVAWRLQRDTSYVPSPVLHDGALYFLKINSTILTAVDAKTGRPVIETQRLDDLSGSIYASPVAAASHVYITARNGTTLVIKHGANTDPVAVNKLDDPIDALGRDRWRPHVAPGSGTFILHTPARWFVNPKPTY